MRVDDKYFQNSQLAINRNRSCSTWDQWERLHNNVRPSRLWLTPGHTRVHHEIQKLNFESLVFSFTILSLLFYRYKVDKCLTCLRAIITLLPRITAAFQSHKGGIYIHHKKMGGGGGSEDSVLLSVRIPSRGRSGEWPPLHSQSCQLCEGEPQAVHNPLKPEIEVRMSVLYCKI